ncbi:prepilin-type N-terminal cleavage/methylation domain-containing protein [Stigmatella sp. ncwal1]|uniref:Prepilin-type N-terminal cleavage/methylation domain-containing protein n=1 Tax=Stigmatella ashevillensis TaxID=2995309 RepID=A0ABT5DHK2_9BACT|nr:prepilin-type N-terminal cleavage/methylation domain-containing protein [Stigmatella ashevillena]MDC0713059.1 prepilin-type N-terminal cleavage/methylation domain-containing protein [Stigmatella ashevillena]
MPVRPRSRGFTMIEVLTVIAILGVMAALASTAIFYGMGRARVSNTLFDLSALMSVAQLRAISHGTPHYLVIYRLNQTRLRASLVERQTPDDSDIDWGNLDLSDGLGAALAYNETDPDTGVVTLRNAIERDTITLASGSGPDEGGINFLDPDAEGVIRDLPAPFSAIKPTTPLFNPPALNEPTTELLAGCTFCINGNGADYGVIRFNADGTVTMRTGGANPTREPGGVLSFMSNTAEGKDVGYKLLVISTPAGVTRVFSP